MGWEEAYRKADEVIARLSTEEKIGMTHGYNDFFFNGAPGKGIPYLYLSDATAGVHIRKNLNDPDMVRQLEKSTAMPCPIMLAATFNTDLAYDYARSVGEECRAGGIEVLLGPGVNIYRSSQCGRNFEYFGEDPFLTARITEQYVKGLQSTGTAACLKHFVANNTEFYRRKANSQVSERALHEIYMPGFKAGIEAGVASVMTGYNLVNGEWCGQSGYVINGLLRESLGFRGAVMTDWRSVYDMEKVVNSGQNVKMPGKPRTYIPESVEDLLRENRISITDIERMIRPQIAMGIAFGLYDRPKYDATMLSRLPQHEQTAYRVAAEGVVLLRNNGILPLTAGRTGRILVTGKFVNSIPVGKGSAAVEGYNHVTLQQALRNRFGSDVVFMRSPFEEDIADADVVILATGTLDSESTERYFALPDEDEQFIERILKHNSNTIVVVNSGSGIRMTGWADKAAAVIYGWYPGQNGSEAIVDVVAGVVNPSGKLPMTIEREFADSPACNSLPEGAQLVRNVNEALVRIYDIPYDEEVLVGYRWYEAKGIEPLFPFGYGLSYTSFDLPRISLSSKTITSDKPVKVSVTVKNTGKREGAEVLQLYVSEKEPTVTRPKKELKGFKKINLQPKGSAVVEMEVSYGDLAFWDEQTRGWKVNPGEYTVSVGTSSAHIKEVLTITAK